MFRLLNFLQARRIFKFDVFGWFIHVFNRSNASNTSNNCNIYDLHVHDLKGNKELPFESEYNGYIDPTSYSNNVVLAHKKEVIDAKKNNKLLYKCGKCDKLHKI